MAGSTRKGRELTRREFLRTGTGFLIGSAASPLMLRCSGSSAEEPGKAPAGEAPSTTAPTGPSLKDLEPSFDLLDHLHMADIQHDGLYIEMGTAARHKFTMGDWMSGWGLETEANGETFCYALEAPARVFFHLDEPGPLRFIVRARREGCRLISVYLNEQPLNRLDLTSDGWAEVEALADESKTRAGENYLKFAFTKPTKKAQDRPVAFAVESIRVCDGSVPVVAGADFSPPKTSLLGRAFKIKDTEYDALLLPVPAVVSYYLEVPSSPRLGFQLGFDPAQGAELEAGVAITDIETGKREEIFSKSSKNGLAWSPQLVPLDRFAGKLVRLDLSSKGGGGHVALGRPAIYSPKTTIETSQGAKARNLLILLIDTQRADHLGFLGSRDVKTPGLDRFAREGVICERCQAPANWTKPSCASVLTGLFPDSHLARSESSKLSRSVRMVSELVKEAGFATGAFIANGYLAAEFGFNRGWDRYTNFIREKRPTEAEHVFKESLGWIEQVKDKPFLAYIQTIDPHVPYDPPKPDLKLYDPAPYDGVIVPRSTGQLLEDIKKGRVVLNPRDKEHLHALYKGEVTYHDRCFDGFVARLKELGLLDQTMIAICADHGEEFYEHGSVGHGHSLYQELLHVPLVFHHPVLAPAGRRIPDVVSLVDIVPTLLEAAGLKAPEALEGASLLPLLAGRPFDGPAAGFSSFWSEADNRNLFWSVRLRDFKLLAKGPARTYLYNLASDPIEATDLDESQTLALRASRIHLGQFLGATDKRLWSLPPQKSQVVPPERKEEKATVPADLKAQLKALGYVN